jgi:uncharacterized SAM-binding protein YcdF (DUF218 family)
MRIIDDITNYIFIDDIPKKSDIIFIPGGSNPEIAERAAKLWKKGFSRYVLPSGKYNVNRGYFPGTKTKKDLYSGEFETEWAFLKYVLIKCGVDESIILKENESCENGTYGNAFNSRKVTDSMGIEIKKAIICCKSFHARRCLMTYQWAYPDTELLVCSADVENAGKANWHDNEYGKDTVMSELRKCGQYFREAIPLFINL